MVLEAPRRDCVLHRVEVALLRFGEDSRPEPVSAGTNQTIVIQLLPSRSDLAGVRLLLHAPAGGARDVSLDKKATRSVLAFCPVLP
jgi:hypothetical protein